MIVNIVPLGWSKETNYPSKGFGLSIATDKAIYHPEDPITITLTVFNYTEDRVIFTFTSTQRYDFFIRQEGREIWRWSAERFFALVMGEERIQPGKSLVYTETYRAKDKLTPGIYSITGMLTCRDSAKPMQATIHVKIYHKESGGP
jgi:hypothetical protein